MKHLKKYKLFESTKSIDEICKEYGIKNYTINPDGTVDVDGDVNLSSKELEKLPVKFGHVTGDFWCHNNQLTSLEGCPTEVGGHFWCHRNQLTTLEGSSTEVGGHFWCDDNQLTTLEGSPTQVGGRFWCNNNRLTTLTGLTDVSIGRDFSHSNNPIYYVTSSWLIDKKFPDMGLIELFNDVGVIVGNKIYLSKLEYFHEEIGKPIPDLEEVKKYYKIIE